MLTVKLRNERTKRTRNVECVEVIVEPAPGGHSVLIKKPGGAADESVLVRKMNGEAAAEEYHVAFVENAQGSTIQVVRP